MACYEPVSAFRLSNGSISFSERGESAEPIELPCGRCTGCLLARASDWSIRCYHESQLHEFNVFVTLTYDDDHMPPNASLNHADFQAFMKRLRSKFSDTRIRYFMCGEYGENLGRPHYHAILFGIDFIDRKEFSVGHSGLPNYVSDTLTSLWGKGHCVVSPFSPAAAGYVARYNLKKVAGDVAGFHYGLLDPVTGEVLHRIPEYCKCSTHPGIGSEWFSKFGQDVFPSDFVVVNGSKMKPPRYYEKLYKRSGGDLSSIKENRVFAAYPKRSDNTRERLAVKHTVKNAAISTFIRS